MHRLTFAAFATVLAAWAATTAPAQTREIARVEDGGQRSSTVLNRRAGLSVKDVQLAVALTELSEKSRVSVAFSPNYLPSHLRVSCACGSATVGEALDKLLAGSGFTYIPFDDQVVVLRDVQPKPVEMMRESAPSRVVLASARLFATRFPLLLDPPASEDSVVAGRVVNAKTGQPIQGAQIVVEGTNRAFVTSSDGQFRIAGLHGEEARLRVVVLGYKTVTQTVRVGAEDISVALEETAIALDELVVTGTLMPTKVKALSSPITVVTARDIERLHVRRFDEIIQLAVPGAVVWEQDATGSNPGRMSIAFRGASSLTLTSDQGSSNPKVYIDGIEVVGNGYSHFQSIPPESIERVEVVRGPQAAAIYGSDAIAGVIQVFTKHGPATGNGRQVTVGASLGRIESSYPESGALRQEYLASVSGRSGTSSYRFGGSYRRVGPWMPDYREETPSLYASVRFGETPLTVAFTGRYENATSERGRDTQTGPLVGTPSCGVGCAVPTNIENRNRFETYGLQVTHRPNSWFWQEATLGVDRSLSVGRKYQPTRFTPADTFLNYNEDHVQRLQAGYRAALTTSLTRGVTGTIMAGADHYSNTTSTMVAYDLTSLLPLTFAAGAVPYVYRSEGTNTGVFVQGQVAIRDALFLTGSLRADDHSDFGETVSWPRSTRIGASYVHELTAAMIIKLRASYGEAIRAPEFGRKDTSVYSSALVQRPNPDLRPERQSGPDLGVDVNFGDRGRIGITYYHQTAEDFIYNALVKGPPDPLPWAYQNLNVARVENSGWEFEGGLDLHRISARGTFAITHSRPEDLGSVQPDASLRVGEQLFAIPEHKATLALTALPMARTAVTVALAYQGESRGYDVRAYYDCVFRSVNCRNTTFDLGDYLGESESYTKLDLSVDQRLNNVFNAYIKIEDVTDTGSKRGYESFAILSGRIVTLGARLDLR